MNTTFLFFQVLFYILLFYAGLCSIFIWGMGNAQRQIYGSIVYNLKPQITAGIRRFDSRRMVKESIREFTPKLQELSNEYSKPLYTNVRMHTTLAMVGILLVLFLIIPGWLLYQNGIRFGVKEILWRALGFYLFMLLFGIYLWFRAVSRYAPFTSSELVDTILTGAIQSLSV